MAVPIWPWPLTPWSLKTFEQCTLTWCIFVPGFIEIPPLSTEISRHVIEMLTDGQQTAGRKLMVIPQPKTCNWPRYNRYFWFLTSKTFSAISTHMMNICDKFHCNPVIKYIDIASSECWWTTDARTAERTARKHHPLCPVF